MKRAPADAFRIEPLGEEALLLRLGDAIDRAVNARVHALAARIAARRPPWLLDIVPAYASLALFFDVDAMDAAEPHAALPPLQRAEDWLRAQRLDDDAFDAPAAEDEAVVIPVYYGGEAGPDLEALARHAGMSVRDVVDLHAGGDYRVAMLGFAPGFAYLLGLDPRLAMPRRETPRTRVPAGSVAVGAGQTGIYPRQGPGGWRLLGRTPLPLFDPARDPPCLLSPGRRVRFESVGGATFPRLAAGS